MKFSHSIISLQIVAFAFLLAPETAQSGAVPQWAGQYATSIKDYLVGMVKDRVIEKSRMMSSFQDTMSTIKNRYESEKQSLGAEATDVEQQALYYKIVADELKNLRVRVSNDPANVDDGKGLDDFKPPRVNIQPSPEDVVDPILDDEEEKELMNQLDEIESLEKSESEMGWSMSPEQRKALGVRTKRVLTDLIQNELKQLAMAVLTSYMSGSPLAPIAAALAGSIRFKMVEYLMNIVMDVLASIMGKKVEIQPIVESETVPASPVSQAFA